MVGANEIRFSVAQVDDVALTIWRQGLEDVQLFRAQRAKRHAARQKGRALRRFRTTHALVPELIKPLYWCQRGEEHVSVSV